MPPAKQAQKDTPETTPDAAAGAVATLSKGDHNPFLQGIIQEGESAEAAIKQWYEQRDKLRQQARMAVDTGFASPEQVEKVRAMWPMPKRKKKDETDQAPSGDQTAATAT